MTAEAHNWLARRQIHGALATAARDHARGRLVDIGCGIKPYGPTFAPYVDEHVGVDHAESPHELGGVDVVAPAYSVPLADASFDTALMTEVLEHLEEPRRALREVSRLLGRGGVLILTTPFMWVLHEEPRDFFRYSPYGLRHVLGDAGFDDVEITPLSGQWGTLALLFAYALRRSPAAQLGRLLGPPVRLLQRFAGWLDARAPEPWMSWNHLVVARKAS